eukprot:1659870-Prorocentrum_lima.AAC.1
MASHASMSSHAHLFGARILLVALERCSHERKNTEQSIARESGTDKGHWCTRVCCKHIAYAQSMWSMMDMSRRDTTQTCVPSVAVASARLTER